MTATALACTFIFAAMAASAPAGALAKSPPPGPAPAALSYRNITTGLNTITMEYGPIEIRGCDIDKDGDTDLVSLGDHGNPLFNTAKENGLMLWTNGGDGQTWSLWQSGGNWGYGGMSFGDLNWDGKWDIAYGMHHNWTTTSGMGDELVEVYLNTGTGKSWSPYGSGIPINSTTFGMFDTAMGDYNNDGLLDISATSFTYENAHQIYRNNGDGSWTFIGFPDTGFNHAHVTEWEDINADGNMDLMASWSKGFIWLGDGNGNFAQHDTGLQNQMKPPRDIDTGDFNNDGYSDLVLTYDPEYSLHAYSWDNSAESWVESSSGLSTGAEWYRCRLADLNNDGNRDIVAAGANGVQVFLGNGAGTWTPDILLAIPGVKSGEVCNELEVVGDVDRNGYLDFVASYAGTTAMSPRNHITLFLNDNPASALGCHILSPRGKEKMAPGGVRFIDWTSSFPGGLKLQKKIEYSTAGSGGPWKSITDATSDAQRYQWQVPNDPSKNCYIRITVSDGVNETFDVTPLPFEILGSSGPDPLIVQLTAPNGGENWAGGSQHAISWSATGGTLPISIKLEYSTAGSAGPWTTIENSISNIGTYSWTVPSGITSSDCHVKVTATDSTATPQAASDQSAAAFTITGQAVGEPGAALPALLGAVCTMVAAAWARRRRG